MINRLSRIALNRRTAQISAVRCKSVKLDAATTPEASTPAVPAPAVWVQVTSAGDFKGYPGGRFAFDKTTFETIVANFRKHPAYMAGADGMGTADVVPWDFHHASEFPPSEGTIPTLGAPAQGWIRELAIREGADGSELWALTRWLEPARSYIKNGQYKWASVVVDFAARDAETNEKLGPTLISVAITNNPFVEGMAPLIAAERGGRRVAAGNYVGGMYCEAACSAEDAYEKLRGLFGLTSLASVGDVLGEMAKVQEYLASGNAPLGIELDEIVGGMRMILNLPALASNEEVFFEASKLLQRLLEEANIPTGTSTAPTQQPLPPADVPAATRRKEAMLIKILASKLLVQENDAAVTEAVEQLLQFRSMLCTIAGLGENVSNKKLLEADAGKSVADARGKLTAILGALGLDEAAAGDAINKIASVMEQSAKLKEVMPELEALRTEQKKVEEQAAEQDVDAAMASKGIEDADLRFALVALRKSDKAEFARRYPPAAAGGAASGAGTKHLTQQIATSSQGSEQRIELTNDGKVRVLKPKLGKSGTDDRIKLTGLSGRNTIEKVMVWLRANGHEKASHEDVWMKACELVRTGKVDESTAA